MQTTASIPASSSSSSSSGLFSRWNTSTPPRNLLPSLDTSITPQRHDLQPELESEEEIISPLFDPSGLTSSLSSDSAFDFDSIAAKRLGISSPDRARSIAVATRAHALPQQGTSDKDTAADAAQGASEGGEDDARRGRRRRSSVGKQPSPPTPPEAAAAPMWWERKQSVHSATAPVATGDDEIGPVIASSAPTTHSRPGPGSFARRGPLASLSPSPSSPLSASSTHRSPAAEFLHSFGRVNAIVSSSAEYHNSHSTRHSQSVSPSPPTTGLRTRAASGTASLMTASFADAGNTLLSRMQYAGDGHRRSVSAADQQQVQLASSFASEPKPADFVMGTMGDSTSMSPQVSSSALDDEGGQIGPEGRYVLGKVIAFGGFSTVRDAYDRIEGKRVAVKLIYSDQSSNFGIGGTSRQAKVAGLTRESVDGEMKLWKGLPQHRHVLPLLWHERVELGREADAQAQMETETERQDPEAAAVAAHSEKMQRAKTRAPAEAAAVDMLVMPLCDAGSLLEFVRNEGKIVPRPAASTTATGTAPGAAKMTSNSSTNSAPGQGHPMSRTSTMQSSDSEKSAPPSSTASTVLTPIVQGEVTHAKSPPRDAVAAGAAAGTTIKPGLPSISTSGPSSLQALLGTASLALSFGTPGHSAAASPLSGSLTGPIPSGSPVTTTTAAAGQPFSSSSSSFSLRRASSRHSVVRSRGVPVGVAKEVMRQLASALKVLHCEANVLHGDLKLENVLAEIPADDASVKQAQDGEGDGEKKDAQGDEYRSPQWRIADFGLATSNPAAVARRETNGKSIPRGGSLPYTAPELLRDTPPPSEGEGAESNAAPSSAFAIDMWAAGCILYALVAGRLPFSDPFEPRLQTKIIKAVWEMPIRLRRKAHPFAAPATPATPYGRITSSGSLVLPHKDRSHSFAAQPPNSPTNSLGRTQSLGHRFARANSGGIRMGMGMGMGMSMGMGMGGENSFDMSQSMSGLPPIAAGGLGSFGGDGDDVFIGSAPDAMQAVEEAIQIESETDPDSDADASIDRVWNGTSRERLQIRRALRGLLEPDPSKRWDVEKLLACDWLSSAKEAARKKAKEEEEDAAQIKLSFEKRDPSQERGRSRIPAGQSRQSSLSRSRPRASHDVSDAGSANAATPSSTNGSSSPGSIVERTSSSAAFSGRTSSNSTNDRRSNLSNSRSRSVGRPPLRLHLDDNGATRSASNSPGPASNTVGGTWSRSILDQTRVDLGPLSAGTAAARRPLRAAASRDSLHFKGFLPASGASSPSVSTMDVSASASPMVGGSPSMNVSSKSQLVSSSSTGTATPIEIRATSPSNKRGRSVSRSRVSPAAIAYSEGGGKQRSLSRSGIPEVLASILDQDRFAQQVHGHGHASPRERSIAEASSDDEGDGADERQPHRQRERQMQDPSKLEAVSRGRTRSRGGQ